MNCPICGALATPLEKYCESCGTPLGQSTTVAPWESAPTAAGMPEPVPAGPAVRSVFLEGSPIRLGSGEVVWKKYRAVRLRGNGGGEGTLYVTDSRVVFYAQARGRGMQRASSLVQQTKLEDITGLAVYVSHRISIGLALVTGGCGLIALAALLTRQWFWLIVWAVVTGACAAVLFGGGTKRGSTGVIIHSRATMASPVGFGNFGTQRGGILRLLLLPFVLFFRAYNAFDVALGAPGEDCDQMIEELGALILDLQTRGAPADGHWGVDTGQGPVRSSGMN
jgi:hypothetical protein